MEEINSLDDFFRRLKAGLVDIVFRRFMNEQTISSISDCGVMDSITSPYPDNISTCTHLFIQQPCSSDAAFHILCVREHIRHITVAGRRYSRQEIACMEAGKNLGGAGDIPAPWDDILTPPPARPTDARFGIEQVPIPTPQYTAEELPQAAPAGGRLPHTTEAQRNIFQAPVGVYEQLQQAGNTVPAAAQPLDLEPMFQQVYQLARERDRQRNAALEHDRIYQNPVNPAPTTFDIARQQDAFEHRRATAGLHNPTPVETLMQTMGVSREYAQRFIDTYTRLDAAGVETEAQRGYSDLDNPLAHIEPGQTVRIDGVNYHNGFMPAQITAEDTYF